MSPINSIKHYVQQPLVGIASGALLEKILVSAVIAPAASATNEVTEGSIVKAIFVEMWLIGTTADIQSSFQFVLEKRTSLITTFSVSNAANLQAYANKKNILFTSQGIVGSETQGQGTIPVIRQWFKVPKGKQRMGLGDEISLEMTSLGGALEVCGFATFKEYR